MIDDKTLLRRFKVTLSDNFDNPKGKFTMMDLLTTLDQYERQSNVDWKFIISQEMTFNPAFVILHQDNQIRQEQFNNVILRDKSQIKIRFR